MASYLNYLLTPTFVPQQPDLNLPPGITPTIPQQRSVHYKTDLWPMKGEYIPRPEPQLMGLLNTPYDPTQDMQFLDGATPPEAYEVQPLPQPDAPMATPPISGFNPNKTAGFDPNSTGGFKLPTGMSPDQVFSVLGSNSGPSPLALLNLASNVMGSSSQQAPRYVPPAPSHRPQPMSIGQLLKLYGVR